MCKKKQKKTLKWTITSPTRFAFMIVKAIWFVLILIPSSIYCLNNWSSCLDFTSLNGNNIIFVVWIFLVLFPVLPGIKISAFGIDLELEKDETQEMIELADKTVAEGVIESAQNKSAEAMKAGLLTLANAIHLATREEESHE